MKKIYHLSVCSTNRKIIKSLPTLEGIDFQDIKKQPLSESDLQHMYDLAGSYEALFSKKAQLYKSLGLKDQTLTESDYKKHLLEHYTFLSRPVAIIEDKIFIGNAPKTVEQLIETLK